MFNQDTPDTTRDVRLEARLSAAQKRLLQQATALSGCTLSEFVVSSARDAARRVLAEHESIRLSREEQSAFVHALLNPPEPNARLKRAARQTGRNSETGAAKPDGSLLDACPRLDNTNDGAPPARANWQEQQDQTIDE